MGTVTDRIPPIGFVLAISIIAVLALLPFANSPIGFPALLTLFVVAGVVGMILTLWLLVLGN